MSAASAPTRNLPRKTHHKTFLVTWNPKKFPWEELEEHMATLAAKGVLNEPWTCWHSGVKQGDRIFLLRQGNNLPGIVASGWAKSGQMMGLDYADRRKKMPYVDVAWDTILDANKHKILSRDELLKGRLAKVHWDTQRSGISIDDGVASLLESKWALLASQVEIYDAYERQAPETTLLEAIRVTKFGQEALRHFADPRFTTHEMAYKLQLAKNIREADAAYTRGETNWSSEMIKAVCSNSNNIVPWRLKDWFKSWCKTSQKTAGQVIHNLINANMTPEKRIEVFSHSVSKAGLTQAGAQLCLASVLLMAGHLTNNPPVRTDVIKESVEKLNIPWSVSKANPSERYQMFMKILDALMTFSQSKPRPITNRLEAQGAVWCVISGWMDEKPSDHIDHEEPAAESDALDELTDTQREAIIAARIGQGKYRNDLLSFWLGCSVTGCQNYAVLRASHLKPWRISDNRERLDPFNGLLLTPNLDHLLDQHLVSFDGNGRILISQHLTGADMEALGIYSGMKIRALDSNHQPYLKHHRGEFHKKEKLRNG